MGRLLGLISHMTQHQSQTRGCVIWDACTYCRTENIVRFETLSSNMTAELVGIGLAAQP